MKQNLIFSISLGLMVGVGAAVGASAVIADQNPDTCSYDPVSGNFIENGVEYNFGSWEHARQCARDGRLPEIVLNRLGAFGEKKTRAEAEKLKAQSRRVAVLRRSKQQKKLLAADVLASMEINAVPETFGVQKTTDPDPNGRTAMEFGTDDENSNDWIK